VFPQSIFIRGQCYPCALRPLTRVHEQWQKPRSYAWFCPVCAEVWARCMVASHDFMVWTHVCEEHEDAFSPAWTIPGSILIPMQTAFNESLPLSLWQREVELHLRHYEKYHQEIES